MPARIVKLNPLPLPEHVAQAVYRGDLLLGERGMLFDVGRNDWFDQDSWPPRERPARPDMSES